MTEGRMKKWWKRVALGLGLLVLLAVAAVAAGLQLAESRMARKVDVKVQPVAYKSDAASLERGRYLFTSRGCVDCHGANGGGRSFVEDGNGLHIRGANITPASGSTV